MRGNRIVGTQGWVTGLGWFSVGLGIAEILAPRQVATFVGVEPKRKGLIRWLGFRELATGVGILTQQRRPAGWLWGRVAGDAIDLALLGSALSSRKTNRNRLAIASAAVAGVTALDALCSWQLSRSNGVRAKGIHITKSIIIERSPEELYQLWRNFEQLPRFMYRLKSVQKTGDNRWHWVASGPMGTDIEWDAEVIMDKPNEVIAWRSLEGAEVEQAGSVRFERAPGGRGTLIKVEMNYNPPGGTVGAQFARIVGNAPEQQIGGDLRRLKQLLETGEISKTEGQPAGRAKSTSRKYDDLVRV